MKILMIRRGLRLLATGNLNSSPLIFRRHSSYSTSFFSSSSRLNANFAADDLLLGNQLATLASEAEIAPNLLQPGVVVYDGVCHLCHNAALRVLAHLPLPYTALSYLMIVPTPLRDAVYDHVAKERYKWFGKSDDCLVLREQDLLDRFIDREELLERSRSVL
ncbi:hypothetical protein AABB24_029656 [Solanum stoloniferum]|uniref:Thiol-disulfide oxidoreductase DCC n=1 Tax=Solanum stoloniferum TaxID=62892 RepID=A0ABD2S0G4_9SOLN